MTKRNQLDQLQQIAGLLLDSRLAQLKICARAMQETKDNISGLAALPAQPGDLAAAVAELRYQRWADVRRAELNLTLARQTASWLDAQADARNAFGKTQGLDAVKTKVLAALSHARQKTN